MSWKINNRSNITIQALLNLLEEEGIDPSLCLQGTGLLVRNILNVETEIPDATEINIIERALSLLPDRAGYGVQVGQSLRVTNFGVWGLALVTTPDLRSVFSMMPHFSEVSITLSKVTVKESDETIRFVLNMDHLPASIRCFLFERYCSMTINFLHEIMPDYRCSSIFLRLPLAEGDYIRQIRALSKLEIIPEADDFEMVVSKEILQQCLPKSDAIVHAHFIQECNAMLEKHEQLPHCAQSVRDYMLKEQNFSPKLSDIARSLYMSERTLKRRLLQEKQRFSEVVLDTKMTLAKEWLTVSLLPVKVVSDRLDYSEPASFVRAFRKWWGITPSEMKKGLAATAHKEHSQ